MPFKIIVYDNFFPYDDSECDVLGVRESYEDAVAYCKSIVDENLTGYYKDGISTDELYDHYKSFGEDPSIHPIPDGEELFSAWSYAEERCSKICNTTTSYKIAEYDSNWETDSFNCRHCDWSGTGAKSVQGDAFNHLVEMDCPKCREKIFVLMYPKITGG